MLFIQIVSDIIEMHFLSDNPIDKQQKKRTTLTVRFAKSINVIEKDTYICYNTIRQLPMVGEYVARN